MKIIKIVNQPQPGLLKKAVNKIIKLLKKLTKLGGDEWPS